ncbi:response regulator transcription factor [Flavobacterium sp.]|uniref:LytR/AlgR family response regulator transcription factor n=1 Tax=Flavobacterium sp. TaxID=239 RepID=UPI00286D9EB6|nr:response regulator transcription factor [Flavobacterium sp.]
MNFLIIEDELLIAEMLKETLFELDYLTVNIVSNISDALHYIENPSNKIDFVFLDINLNDTETGFFIADKLNSIYKIPFVFLTSYSDTVTIQEAVKFNPQAYLIKPFTKSDLFVTLALFKTKQLPSERFFEFKESNISYKIKHNDIKYIKSENIYLEIFTDRKILMRTSLEKFLDKIKDNSFVRVHRSYIVNANYIKAINRQFVLIENQKIPISRTHHETLMSLFTK